MRSDSRSFQTRAEAEAFLEGLQYVNDSQLTAWLSPQHRATVLIEDRDHDDGDAPWPENMRPTTTDDT